MALALAVSNTAIAEEREPAVVEGAVINVQNSRMIPRASVSLIGMNGSRSQATRADGNGHFIFASVQPGQYKLKAERQGFFSDERKRDYQPVFAIGSGEHLKVGVPLIPMAVISGEIVDEYNDFLQNVELRLLASRRRLGRMYLATAGTATTDDRGQYRISGLRPGRYYLVAEYKPNHAALEEFKTKIAERLLEHTQARLGAPGRSEPLLMETPEDAPEPPFTYAPLFYPGSGDFQQAQSLVLSPGDELAANFVFISTPVVSIKGRVTNGMTGAPAEKAVVAAFWTQYVEGEGIPARVSPKDGTFEVRGLAPGFYTLRAVFSDGGETYAGEQAVEVGVRGIENVQIAGLPDFTAAGRVTAWGDSKCDLRSLLIDFVGEGLMPRVRARPAGPEFRFDARLRPERRYRLNVQNMPEDCYVKALFLSGHDAAPDNVVVSGRRGDVEIQLSSQGGRITGSLLDRDDHPTRGSVLLAPDLADPGPAELFRRASADAQGKFAFRGIAPGSYRLLALDSLDLSEQLNQPDFARTVAGHGEPIAVEEKGRYAVSQRLTGSDEH